jgi:CRP/FNR family transcriptional regulator, anaerobic regulatory protein
MPPDGMTWTAPFAMHSPALQARLAALAVQPVPAGTMLFHAGDPARNFVIVLKGRIDVYLTGASGREILLYAVEPGQSCVQSTLGLMGDESFSGEAVAATDLDLFTIPKPMFLAMMDADAGFRAFVMQAFAQRMSDITRLLERVAFGRIESRLAAALIDLADGDTVHATHADLAARIGSAREVISRRLDAMARAGLVSTDRSVVHLRDMMALKRLAATADAL